MKTMTVGVQKAKIARPPKTLRQHLLEDPPEKIRAGQGPLFPPPGLGVAITEAHLAVVAGNDIGLESDAALEITPQIDEGRLAAAYRFAIHDPLLRIASGRGQPGGLDRRHDLRPEDPGQGFMVEQIAALGLAPSFGSPWLALRVHRDSRHAEINLRVIIEPARVGVPHRNRAGRTLQLSVVLGERLYRLPARLQEQVVDHALMRPGRRPEFGGQGEGQQKALAGHLLLQLTFPPLLTLMILKNLVGGRKSRSCFDRLSTNGIFSDHPTGELPFAQSSPRSGRVEGFSCHQQRFRG